jgi:hypothetical protein
MDFQFNSRQSYQIEVGDQYMRFYRNNGLILESPLAINGVGVGTDLIPTTVVHGGHPYSNGDWVYIDGVVGTTEMNKRLFVVSDRTSISYRLKDEHGDYVDASGWTPYISGGTDARVYEIPTPYTQADLYNEENVFRLQRTQSGNTLYIVHSEYPVKQLIRNGETSWTLTDVEFRDGAYLDINNDPNITIDPTVTTGATTLVASSPIFVATDIGRLVRLKHGTTWGYAEITAFSSTTQVDALVKSDFGASTVTSEWRLGRWSETTGYPNAISFFQDRLCFASGLDQTIDFSVTGDYNNFAPTKAVDGDHILTDDSAISININARRINERQWLISNEQGLIVGSTENEWVVRASTLGQSVTQANIQATRISNVGNTAVVPESAGTDTLFVDSSRKQLHRLDYSFSADKFAVPDITTFANYITGRGITEQSYQKKTIRVMWSCLSDGGLIGVSYIPEQEVIAWHRHAIGGQSDQLGTPTKIESVSVISTPDNSNDELYMVVQRWVNGRVVRYVEYKVPIYNSLETLPEDAIIFDSNLTYKGAPVTKISGLDHIEGEEVGIVVDGAGHIDAIVEDGKVQLTGEASTVQVGLKSVARIKTQKLEGGTPLGSSQGRKKRTDRMYVRIRDTKDLRYGEDINNLQLYDRVPIDKIMGLANPLETGDIELQWEGGYSTDAQYIFQFNGGFPATILMISPNVTEYDRS